MKIMEWKPDVCWSATFSIEDAASDSARNVAVQLKDYAGNNMTVCSCIYAYLSTLADGSTLSTAANAVAIQSSGNGLLGTITAGDNFMLTSEADGTIDVDITESSTDDFYLVLVMPNGKLVISDKVNFD